MILDIIILAIYSLSLLFIFLYSLSQLNLLINYLKAKKSPETSLELDLKNLNSLPQVTIQLPVYNELYVMDRLLDNIALIDYPKDKLEIQVLDDSTDESVLLTAQKVGILKRDGLDIKHIRRKNRNGFKAGALKDGLAIAKGEFIAIFDADFLPKSDWLKQTLPYFKNDKIGAVQTRWGHINRNYSLLTKVQAFALDAHFTLEQVGRNAANHFINFNGTAGIWRKTCIEDSGNWNSDTLTEDLDLSYRAQLKQWRIKYLENVVTPAELPVVISAAKTQQFRWNKGGAENFRKNIIAVLQSKNVSTSTKLHAFFHLLNSTMFFNVLIIALLSVPLLYIKNNHPSWAPYFNSLGFLFISTLIFFICYWTMYRTIYGKTIKHFFRFSGMFLSFFTIAMGFSLHNSIAVLEGHQGKKSRFIRTPKFNVSSNTDTWKGNKYLSQNLSFTVILEGLLTLYFAFGLYSAFVVKSGSGDFGFILFHLMLFLGFGFVFFKSIRTKA